MASIRGANGNCPCPICVVPLNMLSDLSEEYPHRNQTLSKTLVDPKEYATLALREIGRAHV